MLKAHILSQPLGQDVARDAGLPLCPTGMVQDLARFRLIAMSIIPESH